MYRNRDFDPGQRLPANAETLARDLDLGVLFSAMAEGDDFLAQVAKRAVLSALGDDADTMLYRQAVLRDCLRHRAVVERLYEVALATLERKRRMWLGLMGFASTPASILRSAVDLLDMLTEALTELKSVTQGQAQAFASEGFRALLSLLDTELTDAYLGRVRIELEHLRFPRGALLRARLGAGNQATGYVLQRPTDAQPGFLGRIFNRKPAYSFRLSERDDLGARTLGEMQSAGMQETAEAVARSADEVLSFFVTLRTELAFYLGCANLHRRLAEKGLPLCFPEPCAAGTRKHACTGLCDPCLALTTHGPVVGNELAADGRQLVVITGANQGGKSTFLRAIGVAQLMMQAGMFVAAEAFSAEICPGLYTHYQREEDKAMERGRFDDELARMSDIVDMLVPGSLLLLNEPFASTNEREGSEVAGQVIRSLLGQRMKIVLVTHLYELARDLWLDRSLATSFLRAEREAGGTRSFKLPPGEPLRTSFGLDLYRAVFGDDTLKASVSRAID